jgi:protoheme ferro-lyase
MNLSKMVVPLLLILILFAGTLSCSNKQDDTNYRRYLLQDKKIEGKVGVLITALGQPEEYEFEFFNRYLNLIFNTAFPPVLKLIVMRDNGTVLMDPDHLKDVEEYKPEILIDCFGKTENEEGTLYKDLPVKWVKSRDGKSPGHFLWEKKNGYVDIVEKVCIKIVSSYYNKMPDKKIPYMQQHKEIFNDISSLLSKEFPGVPMRCGWTMYPETVEKAVDELIEEKVKTIVHFDIFPVYSSLEEFNGVFQDVKDAVAERAKVIYTPFPGAYPSFRKGYVQLAADEILPLPKGERKLLILTRHGFPEIPGDPYPVLNRVYMVNLIKELEKALEGTNTVIVTGDTDFAGEDMDPKEKRLASFEALEMGFKNGYDHIIFVLVDFTSENTDTIFAMRLETFESLHFEYEGEVPYRDQSKPYRTELREGKSRIVVAGVPVGPKYRPYLSQGMFDAIATVLRGQEWPQLILEEEKKKKGMF